MSDQRNLLSSQQQETLQTFQDISQITDDGLAIQVLQQNNWNLDSAVNQFVQDQSGNVSILNATDNVNNNQPRNRLNRTAASTTTNTTNNSNNNNNTNQNTILDVAFLPLRWLFQVRPVSMNPNMDTANFIDEYGRKFGNIHPTFQNCSYQSAVANAFQASKFLLVYLHSPIHEDTNKFCRQVFASPEVVNLADANLLTWTGNIWHPEAYGLSTQLKASAFPFVALLVCQSNRVVQIAERIQGLVTERELVDRLQTAITSFTTVINRTRVETNRREESVRLRETQDREYRESQEADRLEQLRRAEEVRLREEELEEQRLAAEEREAIELSQRLSRDDKTRKLRAYFEQHPEPEASIAEVATIRFQLPQGTKLSRRFLKTDTSQVIVDYLALQFADIAAAGAANTERFSVSMNFPKLELTDMDRTLESLGLHPRGMLYVQDLDA